MCYGTATFSTNVRPHIFKLKDIGDLPPGSLQLAHAHTKKRTQAERERNTLYMRRRRALKAVEVACLGRLADKIGPNAKPEAVRLRRDREQLVRARARYIMSSGDMIGGLYVVSTSEARLLGLNRYFTGEPCPSGHLSPRMIHNGVCCACAEAKRADAQLRRELAALVRKERRVLRAARVPDPEKLKEYKRQYYLRNKEAYLARGHRRRVLIGRSPGHFTSDDVARVKVQQRNKCGACRQPLKKYHVDHVVPLARGGTNEARNIQLLCPSCNCRKHARDPIEFMRSTFGRLL